MRRFPAARAAVLHVVRTYMRDKCLPSAVWFTARNDLGERAVKPAIIFVGVEQG